MPSPPRSTSVGFTLAGDVAGGKEVLGKLLLTDRREIGRAISTGLSTLGFSLPIGFCVPFALLLPLDRPQRRLVIAIVSTVACAVLVFLISGNTNARYEYVVLPPVAVLAGAVAADWRHLSPGRVAVLRIFTIAGIVIWTGAAVGIGFSIRRHSLEPVVLIGAIAGAVVVGVVAIVRLSTGRGSIGWVALLILLMGVPMADRKNAERRRTSAASGAAAELRRLVGSDATVSVASMNRDLPDLFYYAGVHVDAYGEQHLSNLCARAGGQWVVLADSARYPEFSTIQREVPGAFPRGVVLLKTPDTKSHVYAGWYDPPAGESRVVTLVPRGTDFNMED